MSIARDRANRSGSDPLQIDNTKLVTDSGDLKVQDASGNEKKLIADEIHVGTGADKVILKRDSSTGKVAIQTQAAGEAAEGGTVSSTTIYATTDLLPTNPTDGQQALVTANNFLYIAKSNGWYKIAEITNTTPSITSAGNASYTFLTDGTPVSIEITATDAEVGTALQYKYAVSSGSIGSSATVTSSATSGGTYSALAVNTLTTNKFFKVTPSTNNAHAGTFSLTFSASDGVAVATSSASSFTLQFDVSGSFKFDGNGDAVTVPTSADFSFGTGDFTIEGFVHSTSYSNYPYIYDSRTNPSASANAPVLYIHNDNTLRYYVSGSTRINVNYSDYDNKFTHIALQRNSGTTGLYLDGIQKGTWSDSTNYSDQGPVVLGRHGNSSNATYCLNGYMSNVRVVKGSAAYTVNSVSTGSTSFDGNGDNLFIAANSDFQMGTGDFTIEAWVYSTTYSNYPYIIDLRASGASPSSQAAPLIYIQNDNTIRYYVNGSAQISTAYGSYQDKWTHVAAVRNSGTTTLYLDGVSKGTWSDSTNYNVNSEAMIGMRPGTTSQSLNGYISNLRIVKGTAVYTSNFTPPNTALTAITNTKLLTCQNSTGAITDASSSNHTITANGNAAASTQKPFSDYITVPTSDLTAVTNTKLLTLTESTPNNITNGSTYISSTGRRLTMSSSDFTIGTDDFTLETWVKWANLPGSSGQGNYMFDFGANGLVMQFNGSSSLGFWASGLGYLQGSVSISTGVWYHIAWTRSSGTATCYLNGTQVVSGAFAKDVTGTSGFTINGYGGGGSYGQGGVTYSDTRFVRGHVVYTGVFAVPTGPLTKTGGTYPNNTNRTDPTASQTKLLTNQSSSGSVPTDNSDSGHTISVSSGSVTLGAGIEGAPADLSSASRSLSLIGNATHSYATPFEQGTGGSVYFDGSGDSLLIPPTSGNYALRIGTNDFTIEYWVYPIDFAAVRLMLDRRLGSSGEDIVLNHNTDGTIRFYANSGNRITSSAISAGAWTHIALVRDSGTTKMYINGVADSETYSDSTNYTGAQVYIGKHYNSTSYDFYGYISNYREVVGTAVYTTNFTVPTSKLTAVTNTKLLTCNDSNTIDDASTLSNTITISGNTIATRFHPF